MPEYAAQAPQTSIHLPPELDYRLEGFAKLEGISKSDLAQKAIESYLEDLEDVAEAEQTLAEFQASGAKAIPLQEVLKRYGMEY
jgi:RHH-type rel operon transcriptional repressor/antitoxin RelB